MIRILEGKSGTMMLFGGIEMKANSEKLWRETGPESIMKIQLK